MSFVQDAFKTVFFLILLTSTPWCVYSESIPLQAITEVTPKGVISQDMIRESDLLAGRTCKKRKTLLYYLYVADFINSFIEIPTSNVSGDSSTISSRYLAGRAPLYNRHDVKVGNCSASFLCMQNADGIYTDISNYLSVDNGLVVSWFTPTTLINLELDSIVHSMVTECLVIASTKIGFNPFYGKTFNMIVSSDSGKIYFKLSEI